MSPTLKEAGFPHTYRQTQVSQILTAVSRSRSIGVTGLAGMGKSNVVRFIVSHADARQRYLRERSQDFAFVYVDCASLPTTSEDSILEECLAQLHLEGLSSNAPALPSSMLSLRRALRAQVLGLAAERNLVFVLDDFDKAAAVLGEPFFNYSAHLRNSRPFGNLSYVFATRRPMRHLYELQELLDDGCVLGPFSPADANDALDRDEMRLGHAFSADQRRALIACTGGHPGLLKNAAELIASGDIDVQRGNEMAQWLLRSNKVRVVCQDLWGDLTVAERGILGNVAMGIPLGESADRDALSFLLETGLLVAEAGRPADAGGRVFSPLFQAYVRTQAGLSGPVRITPVPPNQARIEGQGGSRTVELAPLLYALLSAFAGARGGALSREEIISAVYGSVEGISDAAISQLVKRLRASLDPDAQRIANDASYTCVETLRGLGFRFHG